MSSKIIPSSTASLSFEQAFTDPEISSFDVVIPNITLSSTGVLVFTLGGVTFYGQSLLLSSAAVTASGGASAVSLISLAGTSKSVFSATVNVYKGASWASVMINAYPDSNQRVSQSMRSTSAPSTLTIAPTIGTFSSGAYQVYGRRG